MPTPPTTDPDQATEDRPQGRGYLLGASRVDRMVAQALAFRSPADQIAAPAAASALLGVTRAEVYVGSACNLACRYCNSRHRREPPWQAGALEGLLDDLAATGTRHIQWTGGEATVNPALPGLVAQATALGMDSSISTNGTASAATYDALVLAGMGRFYISLDLLDGRAFDLETGSRDMLARVQANIGRLCDQPPGVRPHVTVNSLLDPRTLRTLMASDGDALQRLLRWCQEVGVDDFKFLPASRAKLVAVFDAPGSWEHFEALCQREVPATYPMFHYRLRSMRAGGHGLQPERPHPCWFCLDDRAFDSQGAYPCIVRLREGGRPLYQHTDPPRSKLIALSAFLATDRSSDPICKAHCYDLYRELSVRASARLQRSGQPA